MSRKRRARIERILDQAMALVADGGLSALTVHRLAAALDYSPGALYRYFPSMDALVVALQKRVIDAYRAEFEAAVAECRRAGEGRSLDPGAQALAEVLALSRTYLELARRRPAHYALIAALLSDPRQLVDDDLALPIVGPILGLLRLVADRLSAAARTGAIDAGDAMGRALLLWSGLQGLLQIRKLGRFAPEALTFEGLSTALSRSLLLGWGADPAAMDTAEGAFPPDTPRTSAHDRCRRS